MDGIDGISGVEGASLGLGAFLLALLGAVPAGFGPPGPRSRGRLARLPALELASREDLPRRRGQRSTRLPGWLADAGAGGLRRLAGGAAAARLLPGRRDAHPAAPSAAAAPAHLAGAPRALLPARGGGGLEPRAHRRADRRQQPPAGGAGRGLPEAAPPPPPRRWRQARYLSQPCCGIFGRRLGHHAALRHTLHREPRVRGSGARRDHGGRVVRARPAAAPRPRLLLGGCRAPSSSRASCSSPRSRRWSSGARASTAGCGATPRSATWCWWCRRRASRC